jgi:hypothetical protein
VVASDGVSRTWDGRQVMYLSLVTGAEDPDDVAPSPSIVWAFGGHTVKASLMEPATITYGPTPPPPERVIIHDNSPIDHDAIIEALRDGGFPVSAVMAAAIEAACRVVDGNDGDDWDDD